MAQRHKTQVSPAPQAAAVGARDSPAVWHCRQPQGDVSHPSRYICIHSQRGALPCPSSLALVGLVPQRASPCCAAPCPTCDK